MTSCFLSCTKRPFKLWLYSERIFSRSGADPFSESQQKHLDRVNIPENVSIIQDRVTFPENVSIIQPGPNSVVSSMSDCRSSSCKFESQLGHITFSEIYRNVYCHSPSMRQFQYIRLLGEKVADCDRENYQRLRQVKEAIMISQSPHIINQDQGHTI